MGDNESFTFDVGVALHVIQNSFFISKVNTLLIITQTLITLVSSHLKLFGLNYNGNKFAVDTKLNDRR